MDDSVNVDEKKEKQRIDVNKLIDVLISDDGVSRPPSSAGRPASPSGRASLEATLTVERALDQLMVAFGGEERALLPWRQRARLVEGLSNLDEEWRRHPTFRALLHRLSFAFFPGISELDMPKKAQSKESEAAKSSMDNSNTDSVSHSHSASADSYMSGTRKSMSRDKEDSTPIKRNNSYSNMKQRLLGIMRPSSKSREELTGTVKISPKSKNSQQRRATFNHEVSELDVDVEFDDPFSEDEGSLASDVPNSPTQLRHECSEDRQVWLRTPLAPGERIQAILLRQRSGPAMKTTYRLFMQHYAKPEDKEHPDIRESLSSTLTTDGEKSVTMDDKGTGLPSAANTDLEFLMSWRKSKSRTKRASSGLIWCTSNERHWKHAYALAKVRIQNPGLCILEQVTKNFTDATRYGEQIVVRVTESSDKLLHVSAILPEVWHRSLSESNVRPTLNSGHKRSASKDQLINELNDLLATGYAHGGFIGLKSKVPAWSSWQGCHTLSFEGEGRVNEPSRKNIALIQVPNWERNSPDSQRSEARSENSSTPSSSRSMYNAVVSRFPNPSSFVSGSGKSSSATPKEDSSQPDTVLDERRKLPAVLQMGKISDDRFSLDFSSPLSPLQAFVLAMSAFDA